MSGVEQLLSTASTKLDAARLLLNSGFHGDAISRSYYAMFFAAEAALLSVDVSASTHKGVHMLFGKHFVKPGHLSSHLGRDLVHVFEARQVAEYEGGISGTREQAESLLEMAERFVREIERLLE